MEQNSDGGRPEEEILLNVDTFKNLCMITKTENLISAFNFYIEIVIKIFITIKLDGDPVYV
jgi:hypothetical protein